MRVSEPLLFDGEVLSGRPWPSGERKDEPFEIAFGNEASTDAMVADAVAALHTLGSIDHARSMAFAHHETCHAILDTLKPSPNVRALRELTEMQISRMH